MPQTYRSTQGNTPLISTVISGLKSPVLKIKFSNVVTPYYYPNSPRVPRYSITGVFDRDEEKEFLETIQKIEQRESVDSIMKCETENIDGKKCINAKKILIKFQAKDPIPVFQSVESKIEVIELEDELSRGESVQVEFDVLRYTKRHTAEEKKHALSFKPSKVWLLR